MFTPRSPGLAASVSNTERMCDATLSRRQLLRSAALVAATFPAAHLLDPSWALADVAGTGTAVPMNCDLVTVTDTQAVITWFTGDPTTLDAFHRPAPLAAPGRVLIGTSPDMTTWVEVGAHAPTAYHYVEIDGLVPGTRYFWRAESNGVVATGSSIDNNDPSGVSAPPVFTTLVPPPGREIGRVAWLNDLHYGEQTAGLAYSSSALPGGGLPPGFAVDPANPYWRFMGAAAVAEAKGRGCTLLLANGDISSEAAPRDVAEARSALDQFGTVATSRDLHPGDDATYFVTRGNHDRPHSGTAYAACSPDPSPGKFDCFDDVFSACYDPGTTHFSVSIGDDRARYRFVGLDSNDADGAGVLTGDELDYLDGELGRGDATIPLFHHPASDIADLAHIPPGMGGVNSADAAAFRAVVARHPNVAGVYAGHTHRNDRSVASDTGQVPFFEGGAVKEYPGGYTVVRLFEGGYMVNFWKSSTPDARAWSERSRGSYLGLAPNYQLGGLGDRNWVHTLDARLVAPTPVVPEFSRPALLLGAGLGVAALAGIRARTSAAVTPSV